jgi:hypothetical protein
MQLEASSSRTPCSAKREEAREKRGERRGVAEIGGQRGEKKE